MNRRKFLTGVSALFCAPAIIKAENSMKVWVPPSKLIVRDRLFFSGCSGFEDMPYFHGTEITYFGEEIDQIVRVKGESVIIVPEPLPSSIHVVPQFRGEVFIGNGVELLS
ncbi:MAG: hypothetical protein GY785_03280 [Gammaproteobacteria bacterium]|nr:hypothetical protein [Gammaproteobacteria bacterium]